MRFCKYCGIQVPDDAEQCPGCGKTIGVKASTNGNPESSNKTVLNETKTKLNNRRVLLLVALGVVIAIIVLIVANSGKCEASGCNNKAISGMSYCYSHKCAVTSCDNSRFGNSNYCYTHYLLYDDDAESSYTYKPSVYSYELEVSNVKITSNSSYTVAEGSFTNNSDQTVSYVKIKGSFENSSGKVLDTDWTYAVGSEGLEPGETCTWRMSVKKDSSIKDCSVTILDFDY